MFQIMWKRWTPFISCLILIFLVACGTFEVGIEPAVNPDSETVTSSEPTTGSGVLQFMMTPTPVPDPIRVAFIKEGNVWLWTSESGRSAQLTSGGDANDSNVKISDDGEIIAFTKSYELWMVRSDGTDERVLINVAAIDAMEPKDPGVWLYQYEWVPATHLLAFNTHLRTPYGTTLTDDLHLIDADTLEQRTMLPPGDGGEFHYSPDGRQIAIVSAGTISLIDADGSNRREGVLTYTPSRTAAEDRYHAEPVWAADGSFLRVGILPADLMAHPTQATTIWHIPIDGTPGTLVTSVNANLDLPLAFSPDLTHVAYLKPAEGTPSEDELSDMLITNLESKKTTTYPEAQTRIFGWSPDSQHFAVTAFHSDRESIEATIGNLISDPVTIDPAGNRWILDVRWLDVHRYLLLAIDITDGTWNLLLGAIGEPSKVFASIPQLVSGDVPSYDFAR